MSLNLEVGRHVRVLTISALLGALLVGTSVAEGGPRAHPTRSGPFLTVISQSVSIPPATTTLVELDCPASQNLIAVGGGFAFNGGLLATEAIDVVRDEPYVPGPGPSPGWLFGFNNVDAELAESGTVSVVCEANFQEEVYSFKRGFFIFSGSSAGSAQSSCPLGFAAISGGFEAYSPADEASEQVDVFGSFPIISSGTTPVAWIVGAANHRTDHFYAEAVTTVTCEESTLASAQTVKQVDFSIAPMTVTSQAVSCPSGTGAVGGGFHLSGAAGTAEHIDIVESEPQVDGSGAPIGWIAGMSNPNPAVGQGTVYAVCE
jgi:hypothetical protein